ncbi:hypothetical protein CAPN010_03530 [Capnocytophaga cynodegmi]|uniref:hypothetical protein n=1 Tax=Capnocytophaga cynodegmi TaxID=28189 RepID=UPI001EE22F4A|nr:hypothetical protein [Capnocytophaga cynodegmi]GJQ06195.1 hypothetical protein CAPN010_03530 [Capnocytophaga cynodegmi]
MKNIILLLFSFLALSCSKSASENLETASVTIVNNSSRPCDYFCYDSNDKIVRDGRLNGGDAWERFELVKYRSYKIVVYVVGSEGVSLKGEKRFYLEKEEMFKLFNE